MTGSFSWVDFVSLLVAVASLGVTLAIFQIGRRLSFRERQQRDAELTEQAWKVLGPIRKDGLNSKIIVMNAARYARGYDGSNVLTWRGYAYTGPEIIEIDHSGIEVILGGQKSYWADKGRRTLTPTKTPAPNVAKTGHIPWKWIEHVNPDGDEYDGSAIFFVRHHAPGHEPYDYITYREGTSTPFGPNDRDYYSPLPELGTRRPQFFRDWGRFVKLRLQEGIRERRQRKQFAAWNSQP
ncbi:hypothetical protein MRBLWO14_003142 [Microbacterium sp. LWO14-1.2]|uniref:hypothetical protein n=1 Tax=Microbacterium sp. LWO14-1.2 TaxID=3135263 RepID=UPI00313A45F7